MFDWTFFPRLQQSFYNGFRFFFSCFTPLFDSNGPFSHLGFFLFVMACFGALTCVLGLIGSGISALRSSTRSRGGKQ